MNRLYLYYNFVSMKEKILEQNRDAFFKKFENNIIYYQTYIFTADGKKEYIDINIPIQEMIKTRVIFSDNVQSKYLVRFL